MSERKWAVCAVCLGASSRHKNAVPLSELTGESTGDHCPHCGAWCTPKVIGHSHSPSMVKGSYKLGSSMGKVKYE